MWRIVSKYYQKPYDDSTTVSKTLLGYEIQECVTKDGQYITWQGIFGSWDKAKKEIMVVTGVKNLKQVLGKRLPTGQYDCWFVDADRPRTEAEIMAMNIRHQAEDFAEALKKIIA